MKTTSLGQIFVMKEKIHWNRMGKLWNEIGKEIGARFIAYPIIVVLVSLSHYAFSFMHTSFELFLFFRDRERFQSNMIAIYKKTLPQLQ